VGSGGASSPAIMSASFTAATSSFATSKSAAVLRAVPHAPRANTTDTSNAISERAMLVRTQRATNSRNLPLSVGCN